MWFFWLWLGGAITVLGYVIFDKVRGSRQQARVWSCIIDLEARLSLMVDERNFWRERFIQSVHLEDASKSVAGSIQNKKVN